MNRSADWKRFWVENPNPWNITSGGSPLEREVARLSEQELIDLIHPKSSDVVFDAGCGTGKNMILLHSMVKRIVGMDYSDGVVDSCTQTINSHKIDNIEVMQGSITHVPVPDRSIDKVICMSVLQYMNDMEVDSALREFVRILCQDGVLVLHVKNLSSIYLSTLWLLKRLKLLAGKPTKLEYYRSFQWYTQVLRSFGFEIEDYTSSNLLMLDIIPKRFVLRLLRLELRHRNRWFFRIGFIRRHGSELKIRARLRNSRHG